MQLRFSLCGIFLNFAPKMVGYPFHDKMSENNTRTALLSDSI